jgi:hypothetical protein
MTEVDRGHEDGPKISLNQVSLHLGSQKGFWRIGWKVENLAEHSLRLDAARFPHGQFKAAEQRFQPALVLGYRESAPFESIIACAEPAGAVVENAFVIFSAIWLDNRWRIFVRLRVVVDDQGKPTALTELITTQQAGFSTEVQSDS